MVKSGFRLQNSFTHVLLKPVTQLLVPFGVYWSYLCVEKSGNFRAVWRAV